MPGIDGMELLRRLRSGARKLPVIVMTGHGDVPLAVEAMKAGAIDFIEKPFEEEQMLAAVAAAAKREGQINQHEADRSKARARIEALSNRERQVLERIVAGQANKIIAFELGISPRTVEVYRASLMTKMQAASLSDLVRMALQADLQEGGRSLQD
jgi:two-component system response regulator FixJ